VEQVKLFIKQWGVLVAFGVFAVGTLVGFRHWTDHLADQPVIKQYADYLEHLASGSAAARTYRLAYNARSRRDTVASRHFEQVCGVMTRLAQSEGVNPAAYSSEMAAACRTLALYYPGDELP
jgi:predicted negative regulator of RcsB-dependent stress response